MQHCQLGLMHFICSSFDILFFHILLYSLLMFSVEQGWRDGTRVCLLCM